MRFIFPKKVAPMLGTNSISLTFVIVVPLDNTDADLHLADGAWSRINDYLTEFVVHKVSPMVSTNYTNMGMLVKDIFQRLMEDIPKSMIKDIPISQIRMEFENPSLHIIVPA